MKSDLSYELKSFAIALISTLIVTAIILGFLGLVASYPRMVKEQVTHSEYFEISTAGNDILYIEKHPDYENWYSIYSEKFGEVVQGCNAETAFRFLHDNSYRDVEDMYDYNYQSLE